MSADVLLNLLNSLEKRIRCIYMYLYHKKYAKKSFIKQIAGQLIHDTNLISILMYHMLLHKAQHSRKSSLLPASWSSAKLTNKTCYINL